MSKAGFTVKVSGMVQALLSVGGTITFNRRTGHGHHPANTNATDPTLAPHDLIPPSLIAESGGARVMGTSAKGSSGDRQVQLFVDPFADQRFMLMPRHWRSGESPPSSAR